MLYEETKIGDWDIVCWRQFYDFLRKRLERISPHGMESAPPRHRVRARNGDTMETFYWHWLVCTDNPTNVVYLEIQPKFFKDIPDAYMNFRIWDRLDRRNEDRRQVNMGWTNTRNEYCNIIREEADIMNLREIIRPPKPSIPKNITGTGTMRFAVVKREEWLGRDDKRIKKGDILKRLHAYEKILEECFVGN
jgi:hypothetical protein